MKIYHHPNGKWFAYMPDRVLGPFNTYWQAYRAAIEHEKESK